MPPLEDVCAYWALPIRCVRCGCRHNIDRAHVVDRMLGGLDHVGNLRPLCESCHRLQPSFGPEEVDQAVAWFSAGYDPIRDIAREVNAAHEEGWRRAAEELGMSLAEYEDHCIQRVHTTREHDAD